MYPNGQGSWAWPGQGRRCAWALPLQFALLTHSSGSALTTINWIHLFQLNEFIYFALQNLWIHLQNLWLHILNEFISKWIHLFQKENNKKSTMRVEPCTNYHVTLCHTTINLQKKVFFTISILILYMILMSEKMTSQTITDEFIYVSVQGNKRITQTM